MRIEIPEQDPTFLDRCRAEVGDLLCQPSAVQARVCPGCTLPCPCSASPVCTCACSAGCRHAPRQMSSDGENYPIEPGIAPLVHALYSLRLCRPCWSCEGHANPDGTLARIPSAWFHCRSVVYPRVIQDCLDDMRMRRILSCPWRLGVTYSVRDVAETTFAIEPDLVLSPDAKLPALHADIVKMAALLKPAVRDTAKRLSAAWTIS